MDNQNPTPVVVNTAGLTWKTAAYACILALLLGIGLGAWGMHSWQVSDLRQQLAAMTERAKNAENKPAEKIIVPIKGDTVTETKVTYVPKEIIRYVDPKTGQEVTQSLDGEFDIGKTDFVYSVNGKPGQFTKSDDERYIFDKNMLKLTQTSQVNLAVEVPVIDKTKRTAIGPYITTESWGAIISRETDRHRLMLMGGKKWDDKNDRGYEAGGAWQIKF